MATIIELPPQGVPKQLTARAAVVHLGEHFESFLAANNLHGWYPDANYVFRDDRLADRFVLIALSPGLFYIGAESPIKDYGKSPVHRAPKLSAGLCTKCWHMRWAIAVGTLLTNAGRSMILSKIPGLLAGLLVCCLLMSKPSKRLTEQVLVLEWLNVIGSIK